MKQFFDGGCSCGKEHNGLLDDYLIERGAIRKLPEFLKRYDAKKPFVLSDKNTFAAAGNTVVDTLAKVGIPFSAYSFRQDHLEPDEYAVGSAFMHFDTSCDIVIGVGSGVINDIGKILSNIRSVPYIIVGTAPSMDGYASATSSMARDGLKVSIPSKCPNVVIGDLDVLCASPMKMMVSGLGDMLAKYVSICEWKISHIINGEYYCDKIADLVKEALAACVGNAEGLLKRDEKAVAAVFEGLILGGMCMNFAGISRPASGGEHYMSHLVDMRGLSFGTPVDFHGIQCAIATLDCIRVYEQILNIVPDRQKALDYVSSFRIDEWNAKLRELVGEGAEAMISIEKKEGKYDVEKHRVRLETILSHWEDITQIIRTELPSSESIERLLVSMDAPAKWSDIGVSDSMRPILFAASKDIRDKYVCSRLCFDLGILDDIRF